MLWGSIPPAQPLQSSPLLCLRRSIIPALPCLPPQPVLLTLEVSLRGSILAALPKPKTLSLGTHSCSTLPPLPSPSPRLSLAFLRSPALARSIAPIASGTRGNPYPRAPLAHCSGHGLSAWRGVKPQPDGGETMAAIDQGDMLHLSLSRLLGVV